MFAQKFLVISLSLILFSSAIVPLSFASTDSEAEEDIQAGCRDGNTLVFRYSYNDYICVSPSTAERWAELEIAEIVSESKPIKKEITAPPPPKYEDVPTAPPPPPKQTISYDYSECREGYVLVFRFIHNDTFCTSPSAAASWERLGLAEIIEEESSEQSLASPSLKETEKPESIPEDVPESIPEDVPESIPEESLFLSHSSYLLSEGLIEIEEKLWVAMDSYSRIMIVEGEEGLIVIDSLSSFDSSKAVLDELRSITEKPVKLIIFTHVNPSILNSSKVFLEDNQNVPIILSDELLSKFSDQYGLNIPDPFTYSSQFEINVSGVPSAKLIFEEGNVSHQTIIAIPKYDGAVIGDSVFGLLPFVLDFDSVRNLLD